MSAFGLIFASDPHAAVTEMARVAKARSRIAFSAWLPGGALTTTMRLRGEALSAATSTSAPAPTPDSASQAAPFAWHDPTTLDELFMPHGFCVELHCQQLAFTADSPSEFLNTELRVHPVWIAARAILEPRGEMQALHERALEIFEDANEDQSAFRVTSDYVVIVASRF